MPLRRTTSSPGLAAILAATSPARLLPVALPSPIDTANQKCAHIWRVKDGSVKRILVVDDDAAMRELLIETLQDDYVVSVASNGVEALDALQSFAPDAVVLDMVMPVMDGWTFLRVCRETPLGANVLVMVVSAEPSACQDGLRLGAQACVSKPFDIHHLSAAVRQLFARTRRDGL
jgi:CheY-like chemotaxis protein